MKKLKVLFAFLLVFTALVFADNKSIVIKSANIIIDVLEQKTFSRHITSNLIEIARNGHLLPEEEEYANLWVD